MNMNSRLKTMDEAAEYLNIPKSTLYKLCSRNELLYRKIGRYNRFTVDDLEKFIQQQLVESTDLNNEFTSKKIRIRI